MTEGQTLGLRQCEAIEAESDGSVAIVERATSDDARWFNLTVRVAFPRLVKSPDGVRIHHREVFVIAIPADFPFERPTVSTPHTRFAGYPHVQWKRHLCLYQSPATEWDVSDGMYGFMERLDQWVRAAAIGQLDPLGAAQHPPVAYVDPGATRICPKIDVPAVGDQPWFGLAHLVRQPHRIDIDHWSTFDEEATPTYVGAVILLTDPLPFEFPTKVSELFSELAPELARKHPGSSGKDSSV